MAELVVSVAVEIHQLGEEMVRLDGDIAAAIRARDWVYVGTLRELRLDVQLHRSELLRDANSWRLQRRPR